MAEVILYEDKFVKLTNNKIIIKNYYFPIFSAKCVEIKDIISISLFSGFNGRIWGSSDLKHWLACDINRFGTYEAPVGIVAIELKNTYWRPSFTCLQAETVIRIIQERNENVSRHDMVRKGFRMVPVPKGDDDDEGLLKES